MADMSLADLLAAPAGEGNIDWDKGQIPPEVLRYQLMIEAERARQAREGEGDNSIYAAFPQITPEAQAYLMNNYGNAQPTLPPVEGLRLPEARAPMSPVGEGVSLADWIRFQGWAPARREPRPGEHYMGPLPPMPAERPDRTQKSERPPEPKPEPAKKPAKRREQAPAKPRADKQIARSKSGKNFTVGKIYRNAQGQRFRFLADGTFQKVK